MFLINPSNYFTGTYLKPSQHKMKVFIVLLVCDLQPSTYVTKNFILESQGVLEI